jgi:hypothetical protein
MRSWRKISISLIERRNLLCQLRVAGISRHLKMSCMELLDSNPKARVEHSGRMAHFLLPFLFPLYWTISALVLWWAYSIGASIRGGYYEPHQALVLVTKMGLIITTLTTLAWLLLLRRRRKVWTAIWQSAAVLMGYAALVLARWHFSSIPAEDSAFLPIVGNVNSYFFSEFQWLGFMFYVTPVMAAVSGVLYFVYRKVHDEFQ